MLNEEKGALSEQIAEVARLRDAGMFEASRNLSLALLAEHPDDTMLNCQAAWTHDRMGLEDEAIPFYERAIAAGLTGEDLRGVLLGLGSTYRVIGRDADAVRTLAAGVEQFPDDGAMRAFYALALHSAGEHTAATQAFLRVILDTSDDSHIGWYRRALTEYMEHPDELWRDGAWYDRP
ncbi:MAG TPA: tetratricopeptide repeat protein [Thermomicrobiales bacterium]